MVTTRTKSGSLPATPSNSPSARLSASSSPAPAATKRKRAPAGLSLSRNHSSSSEAKKAKVTGSAASATELDPSFVCSFASTTVEPKLNIRFEDARKHLIGADARFARLFDNVVCKPFEGRLEDRVDLFRTLTTSILGQQISWLAARSITHKFLRLFFPTLPPAVKPLPPTNDLPWPSPEQFLAVSEQQLREVGLSGRKAEYVRDLGQRFFDGRLRTDGEDGLAGMEDDELVRKLCEVKGIGKWTVQMLLIFALRRADVLPVSDLGVQKGLLMFYLSSTKGPSVEEAKRTRTKVATGVESGEPQETLNTNSVNDTLAKVDGVAAIATPLPNPPEPATEKQEQGSWEAAQKDDQIAGALSEGNTDATVGASSPMPGIQTTSNRRSPRKPATTNAAKGEKGRRPSPSRSDDPIPGSSRVSNSPMRNGTRTEAATATVTTDADLDQQAREALKRAGLTVATLKGRLTKKAKGGCYLTPSEMEALTEHWRPYRSVAVYFIWSIKDSG